EAEAARGDAEDRLKLSVALADNVIREIAKDPRLRQAGFVDLRAGLLKRVIPLYQALARRQTGRSANARAARAHSHHTQGYLFDELGQLKEAIGEYNTSADLARELIREFPDEPVYRQNLAKSLHSASLAYRKLGNLPASLR